MTTHPSRLPMIWSTTRTTSCRSMLIRMVTGNGLSRARSGSLHQFSCGTPKLARRDPDLSLRKQPEQLQLAAFHRTETMLPLSTNTTITMLKFGIPTQGPSFLETREAQIPFGTSASQERKETRLPRSGLLARSILRTGVHKLERKRRPSLEIIQDAVLLA